MAKHNENDYVIPALLFMYDHGRHATMSEIKNEIGKYIELNEDDLAVFESRRTRKEACYRQTIGNIVSHHNKRFFEYAEHDNPNGPYPKGSLGLTDKGVVFIENLKKNNEARIDLNISTNQGTEVFEKDFVSMNAVDDRMLRYVESHGLNKRPTTDGKLKATILEICGYRCQYAEMIGEKHETFIGEDGKPYVIVHHFIPMSARRDFFPRNLDRASNLICLCPMCHDRIHHGTKEERERILRVIYDHYIEALNDEQIYVSFDDLIEKYY